MTLLLQKPGHLLIVKKNTQPFAFKSVVSNEIRLNLLEFAEFYYFLFLSISSRPDEIKCLDGKVHIF